MRARLARWFVHHVAVAIESAYAANRFGDLAVEKYWARIFRARMRFYLPIAKRVHREAMVDQMIEEGWWG